MIIAVPKSPLSSDKFLSKHFRESHRDYFFDRDPAIFHCVLNYFRTGELHLPTSVCGPVVRSELEFWGVDEVDIEECCWSRYATWATTLQDLRKLEEDRKNNLQLGEYPEKDNSSCFREVRRKAWRFFAQPSSSLPAKIYCCTSLSVIFLNIFSFCANTHEAFQVKEISYLDSSVTPVNSTQSVDAVEHSHPVLRYIDVACLVFFSVELLLRFLVSPQKLRFITLPMSIIEFLALLPDLIDNAMLLSPYAKGPTLLWIIDFMKLLRVFRIFRLMRHIPGLWILFYTLKASIKDLLLLLLFVCVGMLISSSLIYFAERVEQKELFSSIPKCFWWSVVTMTTVGYGDMFPKTNWGYLIGTATGISGVLMIGFTVPVLVNNFVLYYNHTTSTISREEERKRLAGDKKSGRFHGNALSEEDLNLDEAVLGLGGLKSLFSNFTLEVSSGDVKHCSLSVNSIGDSLFVDANESLTSKLNDVEEKHAEIYIP
ncbi:potassium voltage-gated channel protein Shaw-like isoform X2 [Biomphalaria glabrata]|uniref:Potassium voltage-gated channel protein Shaw-like isoform X2 n=1 Tax=Biomphalaria glabrata TaxID=6526 RepID=A0A2C9JUN3_BIOGL|nr:potassium voltage-gated channel protein Shaw-like isoform X2 [Biomphalaria glabrata]